jgi:hypothetical protein
MDGQMLWLSAAVVWQDHHRDMLVSEEGWLPLVARL